MGTLVPGSQVTEAIITETCRTNRGDEGAWVEAVDRLRQQYDAVVEGWAGHPQQPTFHLTLTMERPWLPAEEGAGFQTRDPGPEEEAHA